MPLPANIPQCDHIRITGQRCGSPCVRGKNYCYFHDYARELNTGRRVGALLPEDAFSIQAGILRVINMLEDMAPSPKTCALMLYALQTASANLKRVREDSDSIAEDSKPQEETLLEIMRRELQLEPPPEGTCE
jgi:hypothetical protein